jgi:single-strand DNA-binding protein
MNQYSVAGTLADEVDLRYSGSGTPWATFSIYESVKKGEDREYQYLDVKLFGEQAERFAESAAKGDQVILMGRIEQERWEKDGVKRSKHVLIANDAGLSIRFQPVQVVRSERS